MSTEHEHHEPEPSLLDWIGFHVLYLSILTIAIGVALVGDFAGRSQPTQLRLGLVAGVVAVVLGAPGAVFATRLLDRRPFQPGERGRYALVNGGLLVVGVVVLAGRAWTTWA